MNHLGLLLGLKFTAVRNGFKRLWERSRFELATLILFLGAAGGGLFFFFFQSFRFFKSQEPFGPILIDESFYLFNFALFVMFFISSAVSAYAALFASREVPFLAVRPVTWAEIYFLKLGETLWFSSWSFLFITLPFMTAYGIHKSTELAFFPFLCLIFYIPFVLLSVQLGMLASVVTVWLLPSRSRRAIALAAGLAAVLFLFCRFHPELIKEQGSLAGILAGYLPHVSFAKNALLPSSWITRGILSMVQGAKDIVSFQDGVFYFLVLISNCIFFLIPSYSAARGLYPASFLSAQDHGEIRKPRRLGAEGFFEKFLDSLVWPSRPGLAFLEKDVKTFLRDPTEWSQLIIFFGLLVLYFSNLRNLEFHVLKDFWKNLIFVLNTIGTYVVLSSFSMRFVFPMLSLEGARFWIIGIAPVRFSSLLMVKFLMGTAASCLLTLPLVFFSGWMLEIPGAKIAFALGLGFFVCVALTGLSVGLGAKFLNIKTNNPAEILSGFGGSMLLVTHLGYLAVVGAYLILSKDGGWLTFTTMAAGSLLAGTIPLKLGIRALRKLEI